MVSCTLAWACNWSGMFAASKSGRLAKGSARNELLLWAASSSPAPPGSERNHKLCQLVST
eukprot:605585-Amphidinium_carterae.1